MTKEEPRRLALSLLGEQRQACVKNDTHTYTNDRNKDAVARIRSWGWGAA